MLQPDNDLDKARWLHTRLRRNILGGTWEGFVLDKMRECYGLDNISTMGRPSTAINLVANVTDQTAILYDHPSLISNPEVTDNSPEKQTWDTIATGCHLQSIEQENCRKTVCLREGFVQTLATPSGIQLEVVTPDEIIVEATTGDASEIVALRRARTFIYAESIGQKPAPHDCWERWDIRDPSKPIHEVLDGEGKRVTADVYPVKTSGVPEDGAPVSSGADHPYVWADSEGPYLPWAFYRARYTSETFDPYWGSEVVNGTLDIAIHWTMWGVCLRNNSWPQWYVCDGDVPGTAIATESNTANAPASIELAPNSILRFVSIGQPGTMQVGQLPAADAKSMGDAILVKMNTILNNIGIHPDDISTTQGPQSGVAIQLKASAKRRIAESYAPVFHDADVRLYSLMARVHNTFYAGGDVPTLPTTGWEVEYDLGEQDAAETLAEISQDADLVAIGLRSLVDIAMRYYGLKTPQQAIAKLEEVKRMNTLYPIDSSLLASAGKAATKIATKA